MNNWRTTSAKSVNQGIIRNVTEYSFKNVLVKVSFTLIIFSYRLLLSFTPDDSFMYLSFSLFYFIAMSFVNLFIYE